MPRADPPSSSSASETPQAELKEAPELHGGEIVAPLGPQACKRCSARKRKCDRLLPQCTNCKDAGVHCDTELRAGEKALIRQLAACHRRIEYLQNKVADLEGRRRRVRSGRSADRSEAFPTPARSGSSEQHDAPTTHTGQVNYSSFALSGLITGQTPAVASPVYRFASAAEHTDLPSAEDARRMIRKHLSAYKQTHHNSDSAELEQDIENIWGEDGLVAPAYAVSRYRIFAVMYSTMLDEHADRHDARVETCRQLCMRELPVVLAEENLSLVFMGLWACNEPGGPSLFQIVGLAARTAIAIRLHRRDDVYFSFAPALHEANARSLHNQRRKNIFWGLYSLDRLSMHLSSQPPAIRDCDIDVDYPDIPLALPGLPSDPKVSLCIHNLKERRLYGRIQESLYAVGISADAPLSERLAVVSAYVTEVDQWYQTNPIKMASVALTPEIIRRQALWDVTYHQMLLDLHRSSPLIPDIPSSYVHVLLNSASVSVDLYREYRAQDQILLNWVHLYQIFTSCITLVYCFCECRLRPDLVPLPQDIVIARIAECKILLLEFAPAWPESAHYQAMFNALVASSTETNPTAHQNPQVITFNTSEDSMPLPDWASQPLETVAYTPNEVMRSFWAS